MRRCNELSGGAAKTSGKLLGNCYTAGEDDDEASRRSGGSCCSRLQPARACTPERPGVGARHREGCQAKPWPTRSWSPRRAWTTARRSSGLIPIHTPRSRQRSANSRPTLVVWLAPICAVYRTARPDPEASTPERRAREHGQALGDPHVGDRKSTHLRKGADTSRCAEKWFPNCSQRR
jgi:hypothetical protein